MSTFDLASSEPPGRPALPPLADPSRPAEPSPRAAHVDSDSTAAGSAVVVVDASTPSDIAHDLTPLADRAGSWLSRSLPARMLETALNILHHTEGTRAEARLHHRASASGHKQTQQLVRELGSMLERLEAKAHLTRHAPESNPTPGGAPKGHESPATRAAATGPAPIAASNDDACATPSLEIYLLGPFRAFADDRPIEDWPNGKGKAIFKYMAIRRGQPVPREVLMAVFWPEASQDAARNNLNVAMHGLRKALGRTAPDIPFVLFRQGCYSFNPGLRVWVDAEAFETHVERAQSAERVGDAELAIAHCLEAEATYHNALLVDDRYEDWLIPKRESLQSSYLHVLSRLASHYDSRREFEAYAAATRKMIDVDSCDEEAHRQLMRCYSRMGQTQLALRQYHFCVDALARELNTIPSPHTVALFHQVRRRVVA